MSFDEILDQHPQLLLDFYADWCEPCKWVEPVLDKLNQHYGSRLHIVKINIDKHPELHNLFHIRSVPTLILVQNKNETWRMQGFDTAPVLIKVLDAFLK